MQAFSATLLNDSRVYTAIFAFVINNVHMSFECVMTYDNFVYVLKKEVAFL
jgi:hypothetical protein